MFSFLKKLRGDTSGNVLVIVAGAMPLLIGSAGIATDTIQWTLWKRQLQRAADSAALAGVYQRVQFDNETSVRDAVAADLELNHHTGIDLRAGSPDIELLDPEGAMEDRVQVTLEIQRSLAFSSIFMSSPPIIRATATAANVDTTGLDPCVGAFEPGNVTGLTIGGSANLTLDCGLISNSTSSNAAMNNGQGSTVTAAFIAAVGGVQSSSTWDVDEYMPYVDPMEDPYEEVNPTAAEMSGCATNPPSLTPSTTIPAASTLCFGSISVNPGTVLNLGSDKTIFITGRNANTAGSINIKGTVNCTRCTIVLTNKDMSSTADIGTVDMNGLANWNVTAPTTGKYRGIALMQDRRATGAGTVNKFNGGGNQNITGAVYFPSQTLEYTGSSTANGICLRLYGRRVTFTGSTGINIASTEECIGRGVGFDAPEGVARIRLVA